MMYVWLWILFLLSNWPRLRYLYSTCFCSTFCLLLLMRVYSILILFTHFSLSSSSSSCFTSLLIFLSFFSSLPIFFGRSYRISNVLSLFFYTFFSLSLLKTTKNDCFFTSFNFHRWLHLNVMNVL